MFLVYTGVGYFLLFHDCGSGCGAVVGSGGNCVLVFGSICAGSAFLGGAVFDNDVGDGFSGLARSTIDNAPYTIRARAENALG